MKDADPQTGNKVVKWGACGDVMLLLAKSSGIIDPDSRSVLDERILQGD